MIRTMFIVCVVTIAGCATGDRTAPLPVSIPESGASISYDEFLPDVRRIGWRATEAFYRDDWRELGEAAGSLEKAAGVLRQCKNVPTKLQPVLNARCDDLAAESGKVRAAAVARSADQVGGHLQRVHILIRELRPDIP